MSLFMRISTSLLGSSIVWGIFSAIGFYLFIHIGKFPGGDLLLRFTSHEWVQYVETTFFFIGAAELFLKSGDLSEQRRRLRRPLLPTVDPTGPLPPSEALRLLEHIRSLPSLDQAGYFPRRLSEALTIVHRKGSADTLEDELKYLSELDASRSHSSYAFTRIVIWSIPIWGFLGTVIGITDAVAGLNPTAMDSSVGAVTQSLGGVFDTTALALTLSIGLMFLQHFVDRREARLLEEIDARAADELSNRFSSSLAGPDPHTAVFEEMARAMFLNAERAVDRRIEAAFGRSLTVSLQQHLERLADVEATTAERSHRRWRRVQQALVECSQKLDAHANVLLKVVDSAGHAVQLAAALERNLTMLNSTQHLQETLSNVSGAVNLLNARLSRLPAASDPRSASRSDGMERAA